MRNLKNLIFLRIVLAFILLAGCCELPMVVNMESKASVRGRK